MKDFFAQAAELLKRHKQYRRQAVVFLCLAVIVTFGTVTALKLYGQAMTHQVEVLDCQYAVHEHTEECYDRDEEGNLGTEPLCGYALYVIHTHNDLCYDGNGNLVCTLEEHEKHEHTEECYVTERILTCELEEGEVVPPSGKEDGEEPKEPSEPTEEPTSEPTQEPTEEPTPEPTPEATEEPVPDPTEAPIQETVEPTVPEGPVCGIEAHVHGEECYEDAIVCGFAEEHVHGEGCTAQTLTCAVEEHAHAEGCYDEEGNLTCSMEEHAHQEGCYAQEYICGLEEHTHTEECHAQNLTCALEEHEHTDACYAQAPAAPAQPQENGGAPAAEGGEGLEECNEEGEVHVHTDECYEEVTTLVCGEQELHTHDNSCYTEECFDEDGNLIEGSRPFCGLLQLEEHVHTQECLTTVELTPEEIAAMNQGATLHIHTEECYDEEGNLICGHDATHLHVPECYDEAGQLICGYGTAAHVHESSCYDEEGNIICGYETATHVHEESCYDVDGNLQCGYDAASHVHGAECYDEAGELICGYETASHVHEESCYDADGNLQCGYETARHVHEEGCYDEAGELICGYETASHVHEESCYDAEGNLVCGYETASHVHEESCYDEEGNLICGYDTASDPEDAVMLNGTFTYEADDYTLEIHVQTDVPAESLESDASEESTEESGSETEASDTEEDSATEPSAPEEPSTEDGSEAEEPTTEEEGATESSEAESQPVTDDNAEESEQEESASGIQELSEVGDTDTNVPEAEESQEVPEEANPDEAEGQPAGQIAIEDETSGLTLKMVPLGAEGEIYAEMANYIEGIGGEEEGSKLLDLSVMELHVYRDGEEIDISNCIVAVNITPKAATIEEMIEIFGEETAAEEDAGVVASALQKTADGVRERANVFLKPNMEQVPVLQDVAVENGVVAIARYVNDRLITKTFQGEGFTVTATYRMNANIPAAAQLLAERITEESDSEHYARRQTEYQEALGDETATMRALMKIGFYVEDGNGAFETEVEPEGPVNVTIQFLDENGLAEGRPITVIHFAEEGTELLEGSSVEGGSTTFEMESFSEIAIGYGVENVKVPLDEELRYETDELEVTFRIEGEVNVPVGDIDSEGEAAVPSDSAEGEAGESSTEDGAVIEETDGTEIPEGSESGKEEISSETEADNMISEDGVSVIIENDTLEKDLEFRVDPLGDGAEEYARAVAAVYADGPEGADELDDQLFLQVLSYKVMYDGRKLDLSACTVTAEVKPSAALVEYAETAVDPMTLELNEAEPIADDVDFRPEVVITAVELVEDDAECAIADAMVVNYEALARPMLLTLNNNGDEGIAAFSGTSQANPTFTVQYFARLNTIAEQPKEGADYFKLNVIDTSNNGDGTGGKLPKNTPLGNVYDTNIYEPFIRYEKTRYRLIAPTNAGVKKIYLDAAGNVQTTENLLRIYEDRQHDYITAPGLTYFNRLAENGNYEIKEIWIGAEATKESEDEGDWTILKIGTGVGEISLADVHFTNKSATAENEGFILISNGTVIKLVCEPTKMDVPNGASFYDYDISDGMIYKSNSTSSGTIARGSSTHNDTNQEWYLWTDKKGINSNNSNLAFGNNNTKTTLGNNIFDGKYYLNRINAEMTPTFVYLGFDGCTFSLAESLNVDGTIKYAAGVNAPNLFNESGNPQGKETYKGNGNSLTFERVGDTYTLKTATVSGESIDGLEKFNQPESSTGSDIYATNNFWPMDKVASAGTEGHDPMFGLAGTQEKLYGFSTDGTEGFPSADDGKTHNSYFGMHYTVDFELTEDYIGPLEYLFYGDDDMWVFLSPIDKVGSEGRFTGPGTLICDIGGVHSSVGEYVNLWDWIRQGDAGAYRLSFFYTERGASGSTCWMQFTLPSVSFSTPEQNTGALLIEKNVIGGETESEEFGFSIAFQDAGGNRLQDDYAYMKYSKNIKDEDGNDTVIANDVLIWNDAKFTLKAGEYIVIRYLPDGTKYTITEVGPVDVEEDPDGLNGIAHDDDGNPIWTVKPNNPYTPTITVDGSSAQGQQTGVVTGTISKQKRVGITYNNYYKFTLPETGGSGTIPYTIAGGIIVLFGASFLYKKKFRERRA